MLSEEELWEGLKLFFDDVFPLTFFDQVKLLHSYFVWAVNILDRKIEKSLENLFQLEEWFQPMWDKVHFFKFKLTDKDIDSIFNVNDQRSFCYLKVEDFIKLKQKVQDKHYFLTELVCEYQR